jgi:glycosyltransferase involved in cell wall biosynthesis
MNLRDNTHPLSVLHIITDLAMGGAEMMLYKLISSCDREQFSMRVISLAGNGAIGEKLQQSGISVRTLGMRSGLPNLLALLRLASWIRQESPNIIQTWMYHADLLGGLAARLAGVKRVVWNIRNSNLDLAYVKRSTWWTVRACAWLSNRVPEKIISCSQKALQIHARLGYCEKRMVVIPNGFDLRQFKPDPTARMSVYDELGISNKARLVGYVARFDPQKDHRNFIQAAGLLRQIYPQAQFLLCGNGITWQNSDLKGWIEEENLTDLFHLLGPREDIPRLMAACDLVTVSSAYGEAFSNVLGEAMACGVPCVATDVGDSAYLVAETGRIVAPRESHALTQGWKEILDLADNERIHLGEAARQRVLTLFNLDKVVDQYQQLYRQLG